MLGDVRIRTLSSFGGGRWFASGALHYQVARFVLTERDKESSVFDCIVDMVNGFFLATAIYLQPEGPGDAKAKLKNLVSYTDTGILLSALGFNEKEQEVSAVQLIEMAKKQGSVPNVGVIA